MFFNTGIHTYIWILTNKKSKDRKGLIQLIDAILKRDTSKAVEKLDLGKLE